MRIHLMPPHLASQIAAGEVVERPASVLKELLENSFDAQAQHIKIEVEKAGVDLIRLTDDGFGIHPDDMRLALDNHATSKIKHLEDLSSLSSFGFRGEALSSIASVSDFQIRSRYQDEAQGLCLSKQEDNVELSPCTHPPGTTVDVQRLFFHLPARRKFLKSHYVEQFHLDMVVKRAALMHFDKRIEYVVDGKRQFLLQPATNFEGQKKRLESILGKKFVQQAVNVEFEGHDMTLKGWVGTPEFHKSQSDAQFFFVNHRPIRDKVILHAIRSAYDELLPEGRFPGYVLYLTLPPSQMDVNVHPQKTEVKFEHDRLVHDFVHSNIKKALGKQESLPHHDGTTHQEPSRHTSFSQSRTIAGGGGMKSFSMSPNVYSENSLPPSSASSWRSVGERYLVFFDNNEIKVVDIQRALSQLFVNYINQPETVLASMEIKPILLPVSITLNTKQVTLIESRLSELEHLGIVVSVFYEDKIMVKKIPQLLSFTELDVCFSLMASLLERGWLTDDSFVYDEKLPSNIFDLTRITKQDKLVEQLMELSQIPGLLSSESSRKPSTISLGESALHKCF